MPFSQRLKTLRKNNGLTQRQLADKIGISMRTLQNYESGTKYPRNEDTLKRIAEFFKVSETELVDADDKYVIRAVLSGTSLSAGELNSMVSQMSAMFAGGKLSQSDKDKVIRNLNEAYWNSKK